VSASRFRAHVCLHTGVCNAHMRNHGSTRTDRFAALKRRCETLAPSVALEATVSTRTSALVSGSCCCSCSCCRCCSCSGSTRSNT